MVFCKYFYKFINFSIASLELLDLQFLKLIQLNTANFYFESYQAQYNHQSPHYVLFFLFPLAGIAKDRYIDKIYFLNFFLFRHLIWFFANCQNQQLANQNNQHNFQQK